MKNNPKLNEYVGGMGGSGNPHVTAVRSDTVVQVKVDMLNPVWCIVARANGPLLDGQPLGPLMAVKFAE